MPRPVVAHVKIYVHCWWG